MFSFLSGVTSASKGDDEPAADESQSGGGALDVLATVLGSPSSSNTSANVEVKPSPSRSFEDALVSFFSPSRPRTGTAGGAGGDDGNSDARNGTDSDGPTTELTEQATKRAAEGLRELGSMFSKGLSLVAKEASSIPLVQSFEKEQHRFRQQKEVHNTQGPSLEPWAAYGEETRIKIMQLSLVPTTFTMDRPEDSDFTFDMEAYAPSAAAAMNTDANLAQMRFELVPKSVSEETFWRNYFYCIFVIQREERVSRQRNARLGNPEKETVDYSVSKDHHFQTDMANANESSSASGNDTSLGGLGDGVDLGGGTPNDHTFVSDTFVSDDVAEEEDDSASLSESPTAPVQDTSTADWEAELEAELENYEFQNDITKGDDDDGSVDLEDFLT